VKRLLLAGAIGAAASYFLDRRRGKERRRHMLSFWRESREATLEAGRHAASAVEPLTPVPDQVLKKLDAGGGRTASTVIAERAFGVVFAGLIVGALGYLLDPTRGPQRRERLRGFWNKTSGHVLAFGRRAASAPQVSAPSSMRPSQYTTQTLAGEIVRKGGKRPAG
jgi:hypothetical protein